MISWDEFDADEKPVEKAPAAAAGAAQATARPATPAAPAMVPAAPAAAVTVPAAAHLAGGTGNGTPHPAVVAAALKQVREEGARYETADSTLARAAASLAHLDIAPGLEELEMGAARVQVDDKRMINCRADLNQLVPFKYDWAWQ